MASISGLGQLINFAFSALFVCGTRGYRVVSQVVAEKLEILRWVTLKIVLSVTTYIMMLLNQPFPLSMTEKAVFMDR